MAINLNEFVFMHAEWVLLSKILNLEESRLLVNKATW